MEMTALKSVCSNCTLRELCLPVGLTRAQIEDLDQLVYARKRVAGGESLFLTGDPFRSLYAVRSGFFKTRVTTADGRDQVTGFLMEGEMLGIDGIGAGQHACDAWRSRTARSASSRTRGWRRSRTASSPCSSISTRS
jgi:CRP/FNR family transcriptional regulator